LKIKYQKLQAEFDPRGRELQSMQTNLDAKEKVLAEAASKNMTLSSNASWPTSTTFSREN
jgi:Skp family chaperone for outer membrane proteins